MQRPLTQRPSVGDLSSPVPPTCIALPLLLLTAQVLSKRPALSLVRIHMLINGFMADGQLRGNLLGAPLNAQQSTGSFTYPWLNSWSIATPLRSSIGRHLTSLLGVVTPRASVAAQLPTDGGLVPFQQLGDLRLIVSGFHKSVNLISFSLAEVFVGHKQLRLPGQEALNAKHPQPPNHQLFKVALRA